MENAPQEIATEKHTPGPWRNSHGHIRTTEQSIDFPDGRKLATVHIGPVTMQESVANARLIAAAPDLLAACDELSTIVAHVYAFHELPSGPAILETMDRTRVALARAEGRQP